MTEMHVWVGNEDPFRIPIGGVTLVIHQGTAPLAPRVDKNAPSANNDGTPDGSSRDNHNMDDNEIPPSKVRIITDSLKDPAPVGGTYILKDPTPSRGTYINLLRENIDMSVPDQIDWVLKGRAGTKVGIELPDFVVGGPVGGMDVFGPILDGLRTSPHADLKVHLIRTSDLPLIDE